MQRHFIAVLGTSLYDRCTYVQGERSCTSKFVQDATLNIACGPDLTGVKATICLTEDAKRRNWQDRDYTEWEISQGKGKKGEIYDGLKTVLSVNRELELQELAIPTGKTEDELTDMFYKIYDVIGTEEEIYFDITHGLRNIPMLVMTVLEYAKVTKNISIGGIYYGAFEVGEKDAESGLKKVPLYDVTFYSDLLNWSKAADVFVKHGNSDAILDLFRGEWESYPVHNRREGEARRERLGHLNAMVRALNTLTRCIETGRGRQEKKADESIWKAYRIYARDRKNVTEDLIGNYRPLTVLIDKIDDKLSGFQADDNLQIGIQTIRWSVENGMLQQGYTALEETIKTFLCKKAGVPDNDKIWREDLVKWIVSSLYVVVRERDRDSSGREEKAYERWKDSLSKNSPLFHAAGKSEEEIYEIGRKIFGLLFQGSRMKIVELAQSVGDTRNSINHFGFTRNALSIQHFEEKLKTYFDEFQVIMEEW